MVVLLALLVLLLLLLLFKEVKDDLFDDFPLLLKESVNAGEEDSLNDFRCSPLLRDDDGRRDAVAVVAGAVVVVVLGVLGASTICS